MLDTESLGDVPRLYLEKQRFATASHQLDAAEIKAFSREFDPQRFHLSEERAGASLCATHAASGWHTAALTLRLLVQSGFPTSGGVVGAGGELSWRSQRGRRTGYLFSARSSKLTRRAHAWNAAVFAWAARHATSAARLFNCSHHAPSCRAALQL